MTRLRGRIGPEVESIDLLQLRRAEDALDPGAVDAEAARLSASWDEPFGEIPPDVLRRAVRLALATLRICGDRGFDAFSYKSVEGVSLELDTTHNLASSLVASAGVPYIDENDMLNLTAQLMLGWLADSTPVVPRALRASSRLDPAWRRRVCARRLDRGTTAGEAGQQRGHRCARRGRPVLAHAARAD